MSLRTDLERLSDEHWENSHVKIRPLTSEADLIYAAYECQLTDEQKDLVNPAWFSIGRAYLFREDNYPCIIYNERNEPIGFINLNKWLGGGDAYSWSYFIDKDQQGKGHSHSHGHSQQTDLREVPRQGDGLQRRGLHRADGRRAYRPGPHHLMPWTQKTDSSK